MIIHCEPVDGYICPKCGRQECFLSPSGMLVLCALCPWTEAYPENPQEREEWVNVRNLQRRWE